jgi:hypothetical protein
VVSIGNQHRTKVSHQPHRKLSISLPSPERSPFASTKLRGFRAIDIILSYLVTASHYDYH